MRRVAQALMTFELIIHLIESRHSKTTAENGNTKLLFIWSLLLFPINIDQLFDKVLLVGHSIIN